MDYLIIVGVAITSLGLIGLIYCIAKAFKARKAGLEGEELTAYLKNLVAINMAAFFLSALGLLIVVVGTLL
jgi:hypothetical protein